MASEPSKSAGPARPEGGPAEDSHAVQVANDLLNYLFNSGEVPLGSRIPPERQLADAFGVGRSAVREAIKSLSLLGLVKVRHGDGTYLVSNSLDLLPRVMEWGHLLGRGDTEQVVEARRTVEPSIAALAAERGSPAALEALQQTFDQLEAAADGPTEAYVEAEMAFHQTLADTTANAALSNLLLGLLSLLRVRFLSVYERAAARSHSMAEHAAIVKAVAAGDREGAEQATRLHLAALGTRMLD